MKTILLIPAVLLLLSISLNIQGQDKIYKKNKEVIICKITKIDGNYIQYTQPDYNEGVTFNIAKSRVSKIVYEGGDIMDFEKAEEERENEKERPKAPVDLSSNKQNAIKMDFFSPVVGNLTFGYERSLGAQRSIEASLGIIGIGGTFNPINLFFFVPNKSPKDWVNPAGFFVKIGYKLIRSPETYKKPHLLKGSYLRPEIVFTYFTSDEKQYYNNPLPGQDIYTLTKIDHTVYGFMLNAGKQWIFQDFILLDWHIGIGYGFGVGTQGGYYYSHTQGSNTFPIAITTGLKFGVLF